MAAVLATCRNSKLQAVKDCRHMQLKIDESTWRWGSVLEFGLDPGTDSSSVTRRTGPDNKNC